MGTWLDLQQLGLQMENVKGGSDGAMQGNTKSLAYTTVALLLDLVDENTCNLDKDDPTLNLIHERKDPSR